MTNSNKIILGLLGAAAAGVAIGILLAPDKGGEVRKKIADKASDWASSFGEFLSFGKQKLDSAGDAVANSAKTFADDAANKAEKASNSFA